MNNRTPLIVSAAVFAAMLAASAWAWALLPPGTPIPIHWGIDGQPNGFARGPTALFMLPFMTALIAMLFWGIPAIEPRRLNLMASSKFYRAVWIGTVLLLAVTHGAALYATLHVGVQVGSVIIAAVCLLMIVIGNYLGKTRSMFLGGVRTPWTLSSEYSWQRTHALAGKLFIAAGAVGFAAAVAAPPQTASHVFLVSIIAAAVLSVAMSYVYWLRDPERRPDGAAPQ
jgi:uncharacterized membrane protein